MMAETIPVQVWTARPDGLLDFVTQRTAQFFGVSQHELLGDRWASRVHPDDIERTTACWKQSLETGERYETEFRLLSAQGEYRWHLVRAEAMFAEDGSIAEWFGCTADIEEHKRLEAALDVAAADGATGQPLEGGVPRHDEPRAAHAAQRHRRLRAAHARRHPDSGHGGAAQLPAPHPRSQHICSASSRRC